MAVTEISLEGGRCFATAFHQPTLNCSRPGVFLILRDLYHSPRII